MQRTKSARPQMTALEPRRLLAAIVQDLSFGDRGLVTGDNAVEQPIGRRRDGTVLFLVNYGGGPQVYAIKPDGTFADFQTPYDFHDNAGAEYLLDDADRLYVSGVPSGEVDPQQLPTFRRYPAGDATDGKADPTFTSTSLPRPGPFRGRPSAFFGAYGLAIDSQGRVLTLTTAEYDKPGTYAAQYYRTYLERILPGGGRDTTFGDGGRVLISSESAKNNAGTRLSVGPDDKPVVVFTFPTSPTRVVRYTAGRGAVDATFADTGTLTLPDSNGVTGAVPAFDSAGRLLVAYGLSGKPGRTVVRRFTTAGRADASFGDVNVPVGGVQFFQIDPAGRLVVGGGTNGSSGVGGGGTIFRLTPAGAPDTSFTATGTLSVPYDYLYRTLVTPESIYAYTKVGDDYGYGRFVETESTSYDGTNHRLTVTGTTGADVIRVRRAGGRDVSVSINGAAARVFAGVTQIQVDALDGRDTVVVAAGRPTGVNLGLGNDRLIGTAGVFNVLGGAGNDTITTADGDDSIMAGDDNDTVFAGGGHDTVVNAAGHDETDLGPGGGTFGHRDPYSFETNNDSQIVTGYGDAGDRYDVLTGNGDDIVMLAGGTILVTVGGGDNRVSAVASVGATVRTYDGDNTIVTGPADDTITTGVGRNRVSGGDGDDTIQTSFGRDTINGGPGDDAITDAGGNNWVYGGDGNDSMRTGLGRDVVFGDDGSDTVRASAGNDVIDGGNGRDLLFGSSGDDTLLGGANADRLIGGPGADRLFGNGGDDILTDRADVLDLLKGTDAFDGGPGLDRATLDDEDARTSIEVVL